MKIKWHHLLLPLAVVALAGTVRALQHGGLWYAMVLVAAGCCLVSVVARIRLPQSASLSQRRYLMISAWLSGLTLLFFIGAVSYFVYKICESPR